ncbi:MAG: hypothetical protein ACI8QZ_003796 [Chlamydiales bacterium]|jgi:hypothetical protein
MNRGTALLLAMAALLAHALAIHHNELQAFGAPYDLAHVAFRMARNLVHHGELTWNLGAEGSLASYPSPLLVGIAAIAERLYFPVTTFCQTVGILASLLMIALSASFATNRFGGIIPPLLFVFSGGAAAAASSGTEFPLLAFFVTLAYVSFEHRWNARFSIGLALLALTRPETLILYAGFLLLALLERVIPRHDGQRPMPIWTFAPAALAFALLFLWATPSGSVYGVLLGPLLAFEPDRWRAGLIYLWDFVVSAVIPLLLAFPLLFLVLRRLSGAGARALGLALLWSVFVVAQGGSTLPYSLAMVPALPLIFISIQQGVIAAVDTHQPFLERATWSVLTVVVLLSALASKFPGNLGPFQTYGPHKAWMTASAPIGYGKQAELGRLGLDRELRLTTAMRQLGSSLRRHLDPQTTLLTPWPGAVGYASRLQVVDMFQRLEPWTAAMREPYQPAWAPIATTDMVAVLAGRPDYILPGLLSEGATTQGDAAQRVTRDFCKLDRSPSSERKLLIESAVNEYQLIALPVELGARRTRRGRPFYLLRRRSLGLAPDLKIEQDGDSIRIDLLPLVSIDSAAPKGPPQLAWLQVRLTDDRGHDWWLTPTGGVSNSPKSYARTDMIVRPSERTIELFRFELPEHARERRFDELSAVLVNPGLATTAEAFSRVSEEQVLVLP